MDRDLLYRFFKGQVSAEELKEVKAWTEASEENYRTFLKERKLFDMLQVALPLEQSGEVKAPRTGKHILFPSFVKNCLKYAAVALVAVCMTIGWYSREDKERLLAVQTVTVPSGQRVNVTLPDGTDVWLNAGTTLKYPLSFLEGKREVTLEGEAYFDVVHNEDCPFVVHTYATDVEVLGTEFNVDACPEKDRFEASLIQGKVKLIPSSGEAAPVLLTPGHKSTLVHGKWKVSDIDNYDSYRWKEGLYCFRDKAFPEIMEDLERYYDVDIEIQRKGLDKVVLTGKFRVAEGLDYLLHVLQTDVDFLYSRDEDKNIVYVK